MREPSDFDAFYTASARRVVAQLYAMIGDLSEAEDAVQEAFARAWQRWAQVSECDDPVAWVRKVAFRLSVSSWRKAKNRVHAQRRHGPPSAVPPLSTDTVALVTALRKIPVEQRRAIVLHHLVGLSVEEVAHETGAPVGTVKARLSRGRKALEPHVDDSRDNTVRLEHSLPGG